MKKIILLFICGLLPIILAGCTQYDLIVGNAKKEDVATQIKNYAGLNNYQITYANNELGLYRIEVDKYIQASSSRTVYNYDKDNKKIESKTEINDPEKTRTIYYILKLEQRGNNVLLIPKCGDYRFDTICSSGRAYEFINYLKENGYSVFKVINNNQ